MGRDNSIPVHRLDNRFSGLYVARLGAGKSSQPGYELSRPHRHDFYYCVLLEKGNLELEVDFKKVQVRPGEFYLSYPGQVHKVSSAAMERGWYLAFNPSFIDELLRNVLDQFLPEVIVIPLSPEQLQRLSTLALHIHQADIAEAQAYRDKIMQALLSAFIYQAASAYLSVEGVRLMRHSARAVELTKKFRQLLRHNFRRIKKPSEFAAAMNITATYLNDTVRSVTGFSVTYYIQHELMREAQRLLSQPEMTVKEAANMLGFGDDKYFNRLFSKVTGISPGMFRKRLPVR